MPTEDELTHAVGCLSIVFPEFVAKELATLMDGILSGVQGFTDPLAAAADLNLDSLIGNVSTISEGDVFGNLTSAAVGLTSQYVGRELESSISSLSEQFPGVTKRIQQIQNLSGKVVTTGYLMMGLASDMPYVAAQRMCETIIKMADLKSANLSCMRKHIMQLSNSIIVLAQNVQTYKDGTLEDMDEVALLLTNALTELTNSQRLVNNQVVFDSAAFDRARAALVDVSAILSPAQADGTSILDVATILSFGSVEAGQVAKDNLVLAHIVIPSLISLIEAEMAAAKAQSDIINRTIGLLGGVLASFRSAANTSLVQQQRARGIEDIKTRLGDLLTRVNAARSRRSIKAASAEALLWVSRVKAVIAFMDKLKELEFIEGSAADIGEAMVMQNAFDQLLADLTSINRENVVDGIEDMIPLQTQTLALTKGAGRIVSDLDLDLTNANKMATFHALVAQSSYVQVSRIDESIFLARRQKEICTPFLSIDIGAKENFDQLLDSMRQLGLDRGVDMLNAGQFSEFLDSSMDKLSYLGTVIACLGETITGLDDVQTRLQLSAIRDGLIAKQTSQNIAAADSSDQGLSRLIAGLQNQMTDIQTNAKTVAAILEDLKNLAKGLGMSLSVAAAGFDAFANNLDKLAVGAGGRLSAGLEEFSKHPKGGVPLCE